jgi:glycosyltransferase involved in cell wall biosynthesis
LTIGPTTPRAPIRVLLVSPTFGAYGGMEAFVLAVAETLLHDDRFRLRICFKRTAGFSLQRSFSEICRGFPIEFCDKASRALWSSIAWADVVHGQNASPDTAAMCVVLGRPLVLTIHNVLPSVPAWRRLAWRLASEVAKARWYNSSFVWRTWEPRARSRGSALVPTRSRLPDAWVDPSDRRGFAFLGRLTEGKGADVLVEAYRRSGLDQGTWPLTVMGDGPMREALEKRCVQAGLHGVRFTGLVDGETKARELAQARWLVVPSHWQEPFGLVAVEARSVGVPCIVSADGGLPEAGGRHALVCEPGDIADLQRCLRLAGAMEEADYVERSRRTKSDLDQELVPLSFYAESYLRVAGRRGE